MEILEKEPEPIMAYLEIKYCHSNVFVTDASGYQIMPTLFAAVAVVSGLIWQPPEAEAANDYDDGPSFDGLSSDVVVPAVDNVAHTSAGQFFSWVGQFWSPTGIFSSFLFSRY